MTDTTPIAITPQHLHAGIGVTNKAAVEHGAAWLAPARAKLQEQFAELGDVILIRVLALSRYLGTRPTGPFHYAANEAQNVKPPLFRAACLCPLTGPDDDGNWLGARFVPTQLERVAAKIQREEAAAQN